MLLSRVVGIIILLKVSYEYSVNFTSLQLSRHTLEHQWDRVLQVIKAEPISEILIENVIVQQDTIQKLLNMREFSQNLAKLEIREVVLNYDVFQTIWLSKAAINAHTLIFQQCVLTDKDMAILTKRDNFNIKHISFQNNKISQAGFKYISQASLDNLKGLNLAGNSLFTNQSVELFLKLNLQQLTHLDISATSLSTQNAIKILKRLSRNKLLSLNISTNTFDLDFYKQFTSSRFDVLTHLSMSNLLIGQQIIKFFDDFKFPDLVSLQISKNECFQKQLYKFLNQDNLPRLNKLKIEKTFFDPQFFQHFSHQFNETKFSQLSFSGVNIDGHALKCIEKLDLSSLQTLSIRQSIVNQESLQSFLNSHNFSSLKQLNLQDMLNHGNILSTILNKEWPKLQQLSLSTIENIQINKLKNKDEQSIPNLKNMKIKINNLDNAKTKQLVFHLSKITRNKLTLQFHIGKRQQQKFMKHLSEGNYKTIPRPIIVHIKIINPQLYNKIENMQQTHIKLEIVPNQNARIYAINVHQLVQQEYLQQNYIQTSEFDEAQTINSNQFKQFMNVQQWKYMHKFNLTHLQQFWDYFDCPILGYILYQKRIEIEGNQTCILENIRELSANQISNKCYNLLNRCQMPNLKKLYIQFDFQFKLENNGHKDAPLFRNKYRDLIQISLSDLSTTIQGTKIVQMFGYQQFRALDSLILDSLDIDSFDLVTIFKNSKYMYKISNFVFTSLKANNNLQYILSNFTDDNQSSFDDNTEQQYMQAIENKIDSDIVPMSILVRGQIVSILVPLLANFNLQFLYRLILQSTGVEDQHLLLFINKLKRHSQNEQINLPKLQILMLPDNYLENSATTQLLNIRMPLLRAFTLSLNKIPNILNYLLGSNNTLRLEVFQQSQFLQDSIDVNIGNTNITKNMIILIISTNTLQTIDYKTLSQFNFQSLKHFYMLISNLVKCEALPYLQQVGHYVEHLIIYFQNPNLNMDSDCLVHQGMTYGLETFTDFSQLVELWIINTAPMYSNLKQLLNAIQFSGTIQQIKLIGCYPSGTFYNRISKLNLEFARSIILPFNNVSDPMIASILNKSLTLLQQLVVSSNEFITQNGIKNMQGKTYQNLRYLDMSYTQIKDGGVRVLSTCKFPYLLHLQLVDVQMTDKSMTYISKMNAPNLNILDISNNNLSIKDLLNFDLNYDRFPQIRTLMIYPEMKAEEHQQLIRKINKDRPASHNIKIQTTIINYNDQIQEDLVDDFSI